jgi:hypothetical protein
MNRLSCLIAILLAGCAAAGGVPDSMDPEPRGLDTVLLYREGSATRPVRVREHLCEVDDSSRIAIEVDKTKLLALAAEFGGGASEAPAVKAIDTAIRYVRLTANIVSLLSETKGEVTPAVRSLLSDRARLGREVRECIVAILRSRLPSGLTEDEADDCIGRLAEPLFVCGTKAVGLNLGAFSDLIKSHLDTWESYAFRIKGTYLTPGKSAVGIHVENYDRIPQGGQVQVHSFPRLVGDSLKEMYDLASKLPKAVTVDEVSAKSLDASETGTLGHLKAELEANAAAKAPAVDGEQRRSINNVVDGAININELPSKPRDQIRITAELYRVEEGQETSLVSSSKTFEIQHFGWSARLSSHLILFDRQGDKDVSGKCLPSPSVSWTIHACPRTDIPGVGWLGEIWRFFDPGFGINVAVLAFDDQTFQVGLGLHLTIFGDLLQGGAGYNLNARTKNWYVYVGIGLLEVLDAVPKVTSWIGTSIQG